MKLSIKKACMIGGHTGPRALRPEGRSQDYMSNSSGVEMNSGGGTARLKTVCLSIHALL